MSKRIIAVMAGLAVVAALAVWLVRRNSKEHGNDTASTSRDKGVAGAKRGAPGIDAAAGSLFGTVTEADGAAIAGAVVGVTPLGDGQDVPGLDVHQLTATTAGDGKWSIESLPPGSYAVSATARGYLPDSASPFAVTDGQATNVTLSLSTGGHVVRGTVSDISAGPIAGAIVRMTPLVGVLSARDEDAFTAVTAADGMFEHRVRDGRYRVQAMHSEYVASAHVVEVGGGDQRVDFWLAPGGVIEGVVRSESTGEPVAHAQVVHAREAMMSTGGGGSFASDGRMGTVFSREDGTFSIRGLRSGSIRLGARASGAASRAPTVIALGVAEQVSGVELYVSAAHSIAGKVVVKQSGEPAEGVTVFASGGGGGAKAIAPTGADGAFVIDGLVPGGYTLRARSDRHVAADLGKAVAVDDVDVTGVVVEVGAGATISGRVEPATESEVTIELDTETGSFGGGRIMELASGAASDRTGSDGVFALGPVTPGTHVVVARAADGRKGSATVELTAAGAAAVVIQLEAAASVSGRVVDAAGEPVSDAMVSLKARHADRNVTIIVNGRDMTASQSPTHADGSFEIRGVDAGNYDLSVADVRGDMIPWAKPGNQPSTQPMQLSLAEGENKTGLVLEVEERDGVVRGVALGPDGAPKPDVWVTATPSSMGGLDFGPLGGGPRSPDAPRGPPRSPGDEVENEPGGDERTEVHSTMMVITEDDEGGGELGISGSLPPVLTDSDGRFEITGLRRGEYDLMAEGLRGSARGFAPGVETGSDVELKLVSLTSIDGTVVSGGQPVTRFRVELSGPSMRSKQVRSDDGTFTLDRVDPGQYTVTVTTEEGSGEAPVTVVEGKTAEVTVTLETMSRVTGVVIDPAGRPVGGIDLLVGEGSGQGGISISMEDGEQPARTREDGSFTLRVATGPHVILVMSEDSPGPRLFHPFEVPSEQDVDLGTLTTSN